MIALWSTFKSNDVTLHSIFFRIICAGVKKQQKKILKNCIFKN